MGCMSSEQQQQIDPVIVDAVENVANRFGAQGLCDLIALARDELARAEAALKDLSEL
jgi:capsule polysaccharide export protein KpsE/RkpR